MGTISPTRYRRNRDVGGFTILELVIVLTVVTLILSGLMIPLAARVDLQRTRETEDLATLPGIGRFQRI
jgi:type II secretory pathway pseudopilin PulG